MKNIAVLALLAAVGAAHASVDPVGVSYTVSGVSGNYDLNFTFTNHTGDANMNLYFMGVNLNSLTSSPSGYSGNYSWNPYAFEGVGPNTSFGVTWIDGSSTRLGNGQSLGGFVAHSTAATAPTSVEWFAYGVDYTHGYDGHGSFSTDERKVWNPGFAGTVQAVPEPTSMAALGLGALGILKRRKKA